MFKERWQWLREITKFCIGAEKAQQNLEVIGIGGNKVLVLGEAMEEEEETME